MSDLDFSGKIVLVVGGSTGIGNGIACAFRDRGASVYIWGTRPSAAHYADEQGSDFAGMNYASVDVTDRDAVRSAAAGHAELDVLVQCQGSVLYKRAEFQPEGWAKVVSINLDSLMTCASAFYDALKDRRSAMIVVSSVSAFSATIGNPAYAASKAGAVSLTKTLGRAWAGNGIRVNGIAPGYVDTRLTAITTQNPKKLEAALAATPAGRLGLPKDMADVAIFLASPMADYIYGQTLIVDGGITL